MGNLSGTPRAPSNPTIATAPAAPKGVTVSVSPKAVVSPAAPKNATAPQTPAKPSLPSIPGLPSLPEPPTGTSNPAAPAKPAAPTAPTGKGIHFGGRRKKRTRKKQCGGYKIQYNKQREYGPFTENDFTIGESVIIKGKRKKRNGFITSIQPFGVQLSRRLSDGQYEGLRFYSYNEIKSIRRAAQKKKPKSAAKTRGGRRRRRLSRKKRGGAKAARPRKATEAAEVTTTPTGIAVVAPAVDPAQIAAEDLAAALGPIDAIPAPLMPASPAQAATHIQARYRGNRGRWLAEHRREGLQRREERRQRRYARAQEAEAEQNALNMAPTGIFWLDRARVPDAVAHAYATAPSAVAEANAGGGAYFMRRTFTGGRRRSRKKRNRRSHRRRRRRGAGIFDFFKDTPKKKQKRKEKEEREERNKDAIAEQRFKLHLATAAEQDYLASTKQEGIPNIERMAKMRTASRTAWEYFMTTADYQKFLYETWKVNWGSVPPTEEEMGLIRSLKRYDPVGYRAVQQRTPPAQQGGRRRKTRRHKRR